MSNQTDFPAAPAPAVDKRSRSATRQKLVVSSTAVFAQKGIEGASIGELCAAAGFTRGAFYSNFETKTDLALAVLEHMVEQIVDQLDTGLDQWLDSDLDTQAVVTRIIEGVTDQGLTMNQQAVRVELFLAAFRSPDIREAVTPLRDRMYTAVEGALTRVAHHRHLKFMLPSRDMARIMLTSYSGQLTDRMAMGESTHRAQAVIPTMWLAFTRST